MSNEELTAAVEELRERLDGAEKPKAKKPAPKESRPK
jgi:hypothetical protein